MMKKILFAIAAILTTAVSCTNTVKDNGITQYPWKTYEWVDTCTTRYAVVHTWNGQCGLYDLEKKLNITELEYRELDFSGVMDTEDGRQSIIFLGFKGHSKGLVTIDPDGEVMSALMLDDDMSYRLDSCRTIDPEITSMCRQLLEKDMAAAEGLYGQVLVLESQTGYIKSWVALEDGFNNGSYTDAPLLKKHLSSISNKALLAVCALVDDDTYYWNDSVDTRCGIDTIGNLVIEDHNHAEGGFGRTTYCNAFKGHSDIAMLRALEKSYPQDFEHQWWWVADHPRETDALDIVKVYNFVATGPDRLIEPSVNTDSIKVTLMMGYKAKEVMQQRLFKRYLRATLQDGGYGSAWTETEADLSGDYLVHHNCRITRYDDNIQDMPKYFSEEGLDTYDQAIFIGYFPSDKPRYTICVSIDSRKHLDGREISNTVNSLTDYLNRL